MDWYYHDQTPGESRYASYHQHRRRDTPSNSRRRFVNPYDRDDVSFGVPRETFTWSFPAHTDDSYPSPYHRARSYSPFRGRRYHSDQPAYRARVSDSEDEYQSDHGGVRDHIQEPQVTYEAGDTDEELEEDSRKPAYDGLHVVEVDDDGNEITSEPEKTAGPTAAASSSTPPDGKDWDDPFLHGHYTTSRREDPAASSPSGGGARSTTQDWPSQTQFRTKDNMNLAGDGAWEPQCEKVEASSSKAEPVTRTSDTDPIKSKAQSMGSKKASVYHPPESTSTTFPTDSAVQQDRNWDSPATTISYNKPKSYPLTGIPMSADDTPQVPSPTPISSPPKASVPQHTNLNRDTSGSTTAGGAADTSYIHLDRDTDVSGAAEVPAASGDRRKMPPIAVHLAGQVPSPGVSSNASDSLKDTGPLIDPSPTVESEEEVADSWKRTVAYPVTATGVNTQPNEASSVVEPTDSKPLSPPVDIPSVASAPKPPETETLPAKAVPSASKPRRVDSPLMNGHGRINTGPVASSMPESVKSREPKLPDTTQDISPGRRSTPYHHVYKTAEPRVHSTFTTNATENVTARSTKASASSSVKASQSRSTTRKDVNLQQSTPVDPPRFPEDHRFSNSPHLPSRAKEKGTSKDDAQARIPRPKWDTEPAHQTYDRSTETRQSTPTASTSATEEPEDTVQVVEALLKARRAACEKVQSSEPPDTHDSDGTVSESENPIPLRREPADHSFSGEQTKGMKEDFRETSIGRSRGEQDSRMQDDEPQVDHSRRRHPSTERRPRRSDRESSSRRRPELQAHHRSRKKRRDRKVDIPNESPTAESPPDRTRDWLSNQVEEGMGEWSEEHDGRKQKSSKRYTDQSSRGTRRKHRSSTERSSGAKSLLGKLVRYART